MELRTLRTFVEVVRQGGFSQAAKTVFATQSTVSKAVKHLEDEFGMRLFDRVGRHVKLTPAGEIVYPHALRLLADRDNLLAELDAFRGLARGTLKLGLPPIGSSIFFAPLFAIFRNCYPGIDIRLVEHGSDDLEKRLLAGEIEIAASLLPVSDEFEWQETQVQREPLIVLLSADHPLTNDNSLSLSDLREIPFILFGAGFALNRIILSACRRHRFEPVIAAQSAQTDFIVELVAAGVGVAFLPRSIAERRLNSGVKCVPLAEADTEWHMAMIWRRGGHLSLAAEAWLALLRERVAETQHPLDA